VKTIAEITYGELQAGHVVLDPAGAEWLVHEVRHKMVDGTIRFAARVEHGGRTVWLQGTFGEPIAIVDTTAGDAVETAFRVLGAPTGYIVMEPITGSPKVLRQKLAGHLAIHHRMSVTGAKSDGSAAELHALHASLHSPVSQPGSIPHIHQEIS
jgi:hypothetical protein